MKIKLHAKKTIIKAIKSNPMSLDELKEHFLKEYNKKISIKALYVIISRLIKEGLVFRERGKIWYSNPLQRQQAEILKELEGKSINQLKNRIVVLTNILNLIKPGKIVINKLKLVE
ncbi:hypothetical protein LCGC14_0471630 [marine sediment metagenome]|uniref:Uncharacterized protein n=1 Tax=marine sediment metagenome TaxID=412755 RepID=A0A0F9UYZ3_9ZZZZ|nr:MAG: hypothetical protein Lokiarch_25380 [Candidatus Lokiarchaeum sp. GC14_75]HEC37606.1 hypothetical protein [bacterium]